MEFIREDGFLKLTDSNLKIDRATYRIEPLYRNGEVIGEHAVNKYSNYHPRRMADCKCGGCCG